MLAAVPVAVLQENNLYTYNFNLCPENHRNFFANSAVQKLSGMINSARPAGNSSPLSNALPAG